MSLVVAKFGGTSVGSPERIAAVAERLIARKAQGDYLVVVVSAMGDETDRLLDLAMQVNELPSAREMDVLLSTGEQVSMSLLAMALEKRGQFARSFTGSQAGILTDDNHSAAKIQSVNPTRIRKALREGAIAIVAGFQGATASGKITTLGRGGSDTTAVALAAALDADFCEIYTDVDGVYTADPRICPKARKIEEIGYDEMLEMAAFGSGVLQQRSVELARNEGVVIHCRSSFNDNTGTIVKEASMGMETAIVSGIAYDKSEAKITIRRVPDYKGIAALLFGELAKLNVNIDMIIQNISEDGFTDISFTCPIAELTAVKQAMPKIVKSCDAKEFIVDEDIAMVSAIGSGMKSNPGVAAKFFRVLADKNINISMISTSTIRISVVVQADQAKEAVAALHTAFDLDANDVHEEVYQ